jgi:hypothetical protein
MTRQYAYFVVEGDSDQIILRRVLQKFLGLRVWSGTDMTEAINRWIDKNTFDITSTRYSKQDVYKRIPIPSLLYQDDKELSVLIRHWEGETQLIEKVKGEFDGSDIHKSLSAFAVFADADNKNAGDKAAKYSNAFSQYFEAFPPGPGLISGETQKVGTFIFPDNSTQGVIENLIIECGEYVYPDLLNNAKEYVDKYKLSFGSSPPGWRPYSEEKSILASVVSLLKPGASNLVSFREHDWIDEVSKEKSYSLKRLIRFCTDILSLA